MANRREIHERVLQASNAEELAAAYADWAAHYDADLVGEMGYQAPVMAAELLHHYVQDSSVQILDAGCGTGLVGQALAGLGYQHIVGLDYSADMLARADEKGAYQALMQADLMKPLEFQNAQFNAVICVGTLTLGHVGPQALAELVRVTQTDGVICFTVRDEAWVQDDYPTALRNLSDNNLVESLQERVIPYIEEEGSSCHLCALRVK